MVHVVYNSSNVILQNICFISIFSAIILFIISYNLSRINLVFVETFYANCVFRFRKKFVTNGLTDHSYKGFKILRLLVRY